MIFLLKKFLSPISRYLKKIIRIFIRVIEDLKEKRVDYIFIIYLLYYLFICLLMQPSINLENQNSILAKEYKNLNE